MKGRLPVHTDWRAEGGGEGEEGGGVIEKMDVETETRSGGRLEGQLYQVDGDKMENLVSTFFMSSPANFSVCTSAKKMGPKNALLLTLLRIKCLQLFGTKVMVFIDRL